MPNLAPSGTNATVSIPRNYALRLSNFGFSDTDSNSLLAVRFTMLPTAGTLYYDANGALGGGAGRVAVMAGQVISAADIAAGRVTFVAAADARGANYASLTFQVQDNGGIVDGGIDLDASANTLTFGIAAGSAFGALIDLTGLSASTGFKIQGDVAGDQAGFSVSAAGDVNGDGFADVIVGARGSASGGTNAGAAYVIFGKASGFGSLLDLTGLAATDGFKIQGDVAQDFAGFSVSSAGDVNGDGFADLLVGAYVNDSGGDGAGATYVIFGKGSGFGSLIDLTGLSATDGFKIQGDAATDQSGRSVSLAGDVNGDGFGDVIVGSRYNDSGGANAGAAYVIFGKASGFASLIDLAVLTAADGFKIQGDVAADQAGTSVSSAGDVNGDGIADLIVGAIGHDSGGSNAGAAYVIFGKTTGFGSLVDLTGLAATDGFKIQGDALSDQAGISVSSAGDVNGDGFADILVGAFANDSGGTNAGAAYVIFGMASGFGSVIDLAPANFTSAMGFKIQGDAAGDQAGMSVSSAGDINGDGFADLIVGARLNASGGTNAGAAYVIFGKASGFGTLIDLAGLTANDGFKIQGDAAADFAGASVSAAGDINGDGFADLIVGANGNASGGASAGAAYIIFGHAIPLPNAAPAGTDATLTINEDAPRTLTAADFGYSDIDAHSLLAVRITTLPTAGTLTLSGNAVTAGQSIPVASLPNLIFTPALNANGAGYASLTFQVQDNGGTAGGGVDLDASANTLTFDVTALNDAPTGTDAIITLAEDGSRTFTAADFGYSDVEGNSLVTVRITTLPTAGMLTLNGNAVTAGDSIAVTSLPNLVFTPVANANGTGYASLTFQLQDDGGIAGGGVDLDQFPNTLTVDVTSINDVPSGTDTTVSIPSNYALRLSNFGFTDTDGNTLLAVRFTTLPTAGTLYFDANGALGGGAGRVAVTAGQVISAGDIAAGRVTFVAALGASGANYASLTFQVQDNGGTAGGGVNLDASANTLTFGIAAASSFGTVIDLTGLPTATGFKIQGNFPGEQAGYSVSSAGDVNGDGFADLIIGSPRISLGAAYVVFGKASGFGSLIDLTGLSATNGFMIGGETSSGSFGGSVSSAGDINGDGFADLIVGDTRNYSGGSLAGAAYVIYGKASGFGTAINTFGMPASTGFKIQGDVTRDYAGFSVSSAGDVNGDGFADLIVGATGNDSGGYSAGAAYVIFGKATGFGSLIDLTGLSSADGFKIQGDFQQDLAGFDVSSAGDVNGDGFADIIIGSRNDSGGNDAGAAYVIFGKVSGFGSVIDLDPATFTAAMGFKIQGDIAGDRASDSVSSAGDVNGDGFADLIIGAQGSDSGGLNAGAAYVIFGKASGFGSLLDLSGLAATDGFKIQGEVADDEAGWSVSSSGDINGDGFADLLVGTNRNDSGGVNAGAAYVIFGKASGFGSLVNLAGLSAVDGFKIQGDVAGDGVGRSVSAAGDVNGDGFADLIVGAYRNDSGGTDAGAAYVIFGHAIPVPNIAPAGTDATLTISEDTPRTLTAADFGFSDTDGDSLLAVRITRIPGVGSLALNGVPVMPGDSIPVASLPNLVFTPALNANGAGYASLTFQVQDDGGTADGGVNIDASANTLTFDVTAVDDAPAAVADPTNAVDENATVSITVLGNDTDGDGGPINVATINGSAASVGDAITLASGATATLNADGTISYNPNGRFSSLVSAATASATGATNSSATDSFSYALNGDSSATVTVTINGVTSVADQLGGGTEADALTGTGGNDVFNLSQGGDDTASGGTGNDGFYFGGSFDGNDSVDGGAGTLDQIGLQGVYAAPVMLGATSVVGIEQIVLLAGDDTRFGLTTNPTTSYSFVTGDAAMAAGRSLVFQANALRGSESFTLDASGELDGSVFTYGGRGSDTITGSQNADAFFFGAGRFNASDVVDGQGGSDQMALQGDYSGANAVTFGAGQLLNLELLVCLSNNDTRFGAAGSGTPYGYTLTMNDGNVAAGARLVIQANRLVSDEVLTFNGSAELDGHYTIFSGNGADSIIGGALSDIISGRGGADMLTGGGGNDVFSYSNVTDSSAAAQDHILDFTSGDTINLSAIDAITGGANNAFAFIGDAAFGTTAGQLRAVNTSGNDWLIEGDVNGDGVADLSILVTVSDAHVLGAGDFIL